MIAEINKGSINGGHKNFEEICGNDNFRYSGKGKAVFTAEYHREYQECQRGKDNGIDDLTDPSAAIVSQPE